MTHSKISECYLFIPYFSSYEIMFIPIQKVNVSHSIIAVGAVGVRVPLYLSISKNNLKYVDPSYKMDLDIRDCSRRKTKMSSKQPFIRLN